jgi:hypothetical protein
MISVVIEARGGEHALAMTLATLVPAAAEGFVREVIVADPVGDEATRLVADAAGCVLVGGGRADALSLARSDWVLLVVPGVRLEADWYREASAFIDRARRSADPRRAASFRHAVDDFGVRARLSEAWFGLWHRLRPPATLLAPKAVLIAEARLSVSRLRSRAYVGGLTPA